jgi:hypothetical protein
LALSSIEKFSPDKSIMGQLSLSRSDLTNCTKLFQVLGKSLADTTIALGSISSTLSIAFRGFE